MSADFRSLFINALVNHLGYKEDAAKSAAFYLSNPDNVESFVLDKLVNTASTRTQYLAGYSVMYDLYHKSYRSISDVADALKHRLKPTVYAAMKNTRDEELFYDRDFHEITGFSIQTLIRGFYLARAKPNMADDPVIEVPQQMYYRVACAAYPSDEDKDKRMELYDMLSGRIISPATPVLFNMGFSRGLPTSCMTMSIGDTLDDILGGIHTFGMASNNGAGNGIDLSSIRHSGRTTGIKSIIVMYDKATDYVKQGGRKGASTFSLRCFHKDLEVMIDAADLAGQEDTRARVAKISLLLNDSFMKRVFATDGEDTTWYLFCPHECPELCDLFGDEFEAAYQKRITDDSVSKIKHCAKALWKKIMMMQARFSQPFIGFDCNVNRKNACSHIDRIRAFNLCQEMCLVSTPNEYIGTCNLSALNLSKFVKEDRTFDFEAFGHASEVAIRFINLIIDNAYNNNPLVNATNRDMRPTGLGVCGFADMMHEMHMPLVKYAEVKGKKILALNRTAREHNRNIWRCMYYHALKSSVEEAKKYGPCEKFAGSPASKGILNQDMFKDEGIVTGRNYQHEWDGMYPGQPSSWDDLRKEIQEHGLRNMTLLSVQPTASTAQIINVSEAAEMYTSNMYMRRVLHGEYPVINEYLYKELSSKGLWDAETLEYIRSNRGSIMGLSKIPVDVQEKYATMWDIPSEIIIQLTADRQVYICHSQSMNLYPKVNDDKYITRLLKQGWLAGLKTGVYYMQARAASKPLEFGFSASKALDASDATDDIECLGCVN